MRWIIVPLVLAMTPAAAQDVEFGEQLYTAFCVSCHGAEGRGDGAFTDVLEVPPADLSVLSADNGGVFPTARVARQIDGRDPALAHGGVMPLFGQYFGMEDVAIPSEAGQPILTTWPLASLVLYLESLQVE